jgi:hypothetical protein
VLSICFAITTLAAPEDVSVRVVDAENHPVAGAWVAAFLATAHGFEQGRDGASGIDVVQPWIEGGARGIPGGAVEWVASDATGIARVRLDEFWNDVVVVTPGASGHSILARGTVAAADAIDVVVRPHRYWRVPVVDGTDPKARPRVGVEFGTEGSPSGRDSYRHIAVRTTAGDDNVATLGPIDLLFDPLELEPEIAARLDLPITPALRLRLRASAGDAGAGALSIPAHGSLEVRVVDTSGRTVKGNATVRVERDRSEPIFSRGWQNSDLGTWKRTTVDGVALFDIVGLGAELVLTDESGRSWRDQDPPPNPFDQVGALPALTRPGERRVATIAATEPPQREVLLRGRALGPEGVLSKRLLCVDFHVGEKAAGGREGFWRRSDVESDADGAFESVLRFPAAASGRAYLVIGDCGSPAEIGESPRAARCFEIEHVEAWNGFPSTDVVLETLPLLAAGRVVGDGGEPIARANVYLQCDDGALSGDASVPEWWARLYERTLAHTDRSGHFELRGFGRTQMRKLATRHGEFAGFEEITVRPGTEDLVLRLERGGAQDGQGPYGAIAGSLLLDPGVPRSAVGVSILAKGTEGRDSWQLDGWDDRVPADRFGGERIPEGTAVVTVSLSEVSGRRIELVHVPDVRILKGRTTLLPAIDLRGRIKVKRIAVADRNGDPVAAGFVIVAAAENPQLVESDVFSYFFDGECVLCTRTEWPTLDFKAAGFRRVRRTPSSAAVERVVLPPPLIVHVNLPHDLALPPAPMTLDIGLSEMNEGLQVLYSGCTSPPTGDSASFDERRIVELRLPSAGRYELKVNVSLRESSPGHSSWRGYDVLTSTHSFRDDDEPVRIELEISQEQIDHAVRELSR